MRTFFLAVAFVVTLCIAMPAQATVWVYNNIPIDGLQEVPPVATTGTGLGMATLDDVSGAMSVSGSFSSLIAPASNAHIHCCAPPGMAAGVLFPLTFTPATSGTISGNAVLSAANVQNVLNGLTYINIHSSFRPGGEIRGQLLNPVPEPATALLLAAGAGGLFLLRRRFRG